MPTNPTQSDQIEETKKLAVETLTGDVRDFLRGRWQNFTKPWVAMTEEEQADAIHQCRDAAEALVKQVVEIIASEGRKAMVGQLVKINIKDKIQCQVDFNKNDEQRHDLFDSQGLSVLLVVADAEKFTGEKAPALPDPNQTDLLAAAEGVKASGKTGDEKVTELHPGDK